MKSIAAEENLRQGAYQTFSLPRWVIYIGSEGLHYHSSEGLLFI